jgi:DNA-binding response OmpR family regulator
VILISGLPNAETHAQAKRLGARCLLEKPFHLGELRAAVQSVLRANPPGPRDAS